MTTTASSQPTSAPLRIPPPTFQLLGAEFLEAADGRAKVRFVPGGLLGLASFCVRP